MPTKEAATLKYREEVFSKVRTLPSSVNLPMGYDELMQNNITTESIIKAIKKVTSHTACIFIKVKTGCYHKVMMENIFLIEAVADYIRLYTNERTYIVHSTMKNVLNKLCKTDFVQVHRSYIVRTELILKIEHSSVVLKDRLIPIGPRFQRQFIAKLNIII